MGNDPSKSLGSEEVLTPARAAVVPRARRFDRSASLPLERQIAGCFAGGLSRVVNLVGPIGSGKTTALRHLLAAEEGRSGTPLRVVDRPITAFEAERLAATQRVVFASTEPIYLARFPTFVLSPWTDEDLAEYLLATHPQRCRPVMRKVCDEAGRGIFAGLPLLWCGILDELAADESVPGVWAALERFLDRNLDDPAEMSACEAYCLSRAHPCPKDVPAPPAVSARAARLAAQSAVWMVLGARLLCRRLTRWTLLDELNFPMAPPFLDHVARAIAPVPDALFNLKTCVRFGAERQPTCASILHRIDPTWRPAADTIRNLRFAHLSGVDWAEIELPRVDFSSAKLAGATLCRANLSSAILAAADLSGANLLDAQLSDARARAAELLGADLRRANAERIHLVRANLTGANLSDGSFLHADFTEANLQSATCHRTDLREAAFVESEIAACDFEGSDLSSALFRKVGLADAG